MPRRFLPPFIDLLSSLLYSLLLLALLWGVYLLGKTSRRDLFYYTHTMRLLGDKKRLTNKKMGVFLRLKESMALGGVGMGAGGSCVAGYVGYMAYSGQGCQELDSQQGQEISRSRECWVFPWLGFFSCMAIILSGILVCLFWRWLFSALVKAQKEKLRLINTKLNLYVGEMINEFGQETIEEVLGKINRDKEKAIENLKAEKNKMKDLNKQLKQKMIVTETANQAYSLFTKKIGEFVWCGDCVTYLAFSNDEPEEEGLSTLFSSSDFGVTKEPLDSNQSRKTVVSQNTRKKSPEKNQPLVLSSEEESIDELIKRRKTANSDELQVSKSKKKKSTTPDKETKEKPDSELNPKFEIGSNQERTKSKRKKKTIEFEDTDYKFIEEENPPKFINSDVKSAKSFFHFKNLLDLPTKSSRRRFSSRLSIPTLPCKHNCTARFLTLFQKAQQKLQKNLLHVKNFEKKLNKTEIVVNFGHDF